MRDFRSGWYLQPAGVAHWRFLHERLHLLGLVHADTDELHALSGKTLLQTREIGISSTQGGHQVAQ